MDDDAMRLIDDAINLGAAAVQLRHGFARRECAAAVPGALARLEDALRLLDQACQEAAQMLIPPAEAGSPVTLRYAQAATDWPASLDTSAPTHEQQIELLAALHDAAAALYVAAQRCGRAGGLIAATMHRR